MSLRTMNFLIELNCQSLPFSDQACFADCLVLLELGENLTAKQAAVTQHFFLQCDCA
jgi:hypothetical protein